MSELLLDQKPIVEKYLANSYRDLSSSSFISIFAWQNFFQFDFKVINDCLCIFAKNEIGAFLYLPPLGKNVTAQVIDICFDRMKEANGGSGVTRIENVSAHQLDWFPREKFAHYNKGYEYCYYRDDIAGFQGNAYKSKRSSYNQFVASYEHQYLPYEEGMIEACLDLYRDWSTKRSEAHVDDIYRHMLAENEQVHRLVLGHFRSLGLTGRVVSIEGKIKAYTFGFSVNKDMFCILFEVADLDVRGLAGFIFREFCRDEDLGKYKFINAMDDLGMEHMREAKMSYHPSALLPSYVVTKVK